MSQRDKILALLRVNGIMTQAELAEAIYQDNLQMSNIYNALMLLVKDDLVIRLGAINNLQVINSAFFQLTTHHFC